MREPGTGKFLPVGWYCPYCNATEFKNQCRTCGKIEPNPDREEFKKTGICYRCEEYTEKMAKSHVPLTTFTNPAADDGHQDPDDDPCAGCLSWEICPGTLNDKWCNAHRKYPEEKDRECIHPPAVVPASMLELVRPLISKTELSGMKSTTPPKKFGVAVCRALKCPELKKDENPYGPQGERCSIFNTMPGNLPCCIKDPEIPARTFLHTAIWSLLSKTEQGRDKKTPGPRNCPAKCPYKVSEGGSVKDRSKKDFYATKKGLIWKCAFSGDVLGTGLASYCPCHVLDNPDQDKQIEELRIGIEERRAKPDSVCAWMCPDGIDRLTPKGLKGDTCPVCKVKYKEIKVCPLWRIPGELLDRQCIPEEPAAAGPQEKHGSLRPRSRCSS